jgi:hypothetical protein
MLNFVLVVTAGITHKLFYNLLRIEEQKHFSAEKLAVRVVYWLIAINNVYI